MALAAPINLCLDGGPYNYGSVTPGASYTLSWDAVSGAHGYSVYYSETQDGSYTWVKDVATTSTTVNAPDTYSTYRYFKVRTMSSTGNEDSGLSSEYRSMYTKASPADTCTLPTTYYLDGIAGNISGVAPGSQLTLSWTGATGAIRSYSVSYTDTGEYPLQHLGQTSNQSMQVTAPDTPLTTRRFIVSVNSSVLGGDAYAGVDSGITLTTGSGTPVEPPPFTSTTGIAYFNGTQWSTAIPWCYTNIGWVKPTVHQYINGGWTKIWPLKSDNSYTVETISGAQYGFTLNSSGYFQSDNKGVHSSYAICKVKIVADGSSAVYADCINYAESNFDYGILSNINTTLTLSSSADTTNVKQSFKGMQSAGVQTVSYGTLPAGEHYIYVKFIKDGSASFNNDTLQFKIRFVNSSSLECFYSVASVSGALYGFSLNNSGYYQSNNKGIGGSYAICKVNIVSDGIKTTYFDCINYGENRWDYGMLSQVNTTLALNNTADSTVQQSFKTSSSTSVQTVNYGVLPAGEHYVYVKYIKDGSGDSGNDTLQFKVRFA